MALSDYLPFNPNTRVSRTDEDTREIFDYIGITRWSQIFVDIQDESADISNLRPYRANTPEEVLAEFYERGIVQFIKLVYYAEEDLYGVIVDVESG